MTAGSEVDEPVSSRGPAAGEGARHADFSHPLTSKWLSFTLSFLDLGLLEVLSQHA